MKTTDMRVAVIDAVRANPGTIAEISEAAGVDISLAAATLAALCERGHARGVLHGRTRAAATYRMLNVRGSAEKIAADLAVEVEAAT